VFNIIYTFSLTGDTRTCIPMRTFKKVYKLKQVGLALHYHRRQKTAAFYFCNSFVRTSIM